MLVLAAVRDTVPIRRGDSLLRSMVQCLLLCPIFLPFYTKIFVVAIVQLQLSP
jgi:hypothetical protein